MSRSDGEVNNPDGINNRTSNTAIKSTTSDGIKSTTANDYESVRVSVPWQEFPLLKASLTSAFRNLSLGNSNELCISIKNSKNGIVLGFQNLTEDVEQSLRKGTSAKTSAEETNPSTPTSLSPETGDQRPVIMMKRNYMSVDDVFSLPELKEQSVQCDIEKVDDKGNFLSSMLFHPYRLKPNRQVKCVQCKLLPSIKSTIKPPP